LSHDSLTVIESGDLLAERAYAQLSTAILRNVLSPGSSLSVPELARRLGISRSPVREAVQRLIYDGLADYRGRKGTVVSTIEIEDFLSLLEVREVLEALAASLAARHGNDKERKALIAVHEEFMSQSPAMGETAVTYSQIDMKFHTLIREMAKNPELDAALARTQGRGHLSLFSLWSGERNVDAAQAEHAAMCEAIVIGDEDMASGTARAHISSLRQRVLAEGN
jgi:DNA-binding GntR family transcriptional regulator